SQQTNYSLGVALFQVGYSAASRLLATYLYLLNHKKLHLKIPKTSTETTRLLYTLKLQIYPISTLALSVCHVLACRLRNPNARNPLSGHEFHVEKANRILWNTVEQLILFSGNILVFSLVSGKYFFLTPFLVSCFTTGRLMYAVGYCAHPQYRALGFVWTFFPTMAMMFFNLASVSEFLND